MKNSEDKKLVALNHLENKYGGSFEIVSFIARNIDMPFDEIVMMDQYGNKFFVYIRDDDNGNEVVQDEYYGVLKANEYKQKVRSVIDKYFTDYKFFSTFTANYFDNRYDRNYMLSDALKSNKTQFFSKNYVFVSEKNLISVSESAYEELSNEIEDAGLSLYIAVYHVSEDEFKNIDESKDVDLFLPNDYKVDPVFKRTIK